MKVAPNNIEVPDAGIQGSAAYTTPPSGSEAIENRLRRFRPIEGRALRLGVRALPWTVLVFVVATLLTRNIDPMFITGLLAAAGASFLLQVLLDKLPETLDHLWKQRVLATRTSSGVDLTDAYLLFISNFQRDLNRRRSWLLGAAIAFLMFLSFSARFSNGPGWWKHPLEWLFTMVRFAQWSYLELAGLQLVLAFVLGLLLWRMLRVAVAVYRLDELFDFSLQLQHPDRCGGLRPLGDVCLTNALILSAPAIFLASWLIVIPGFGTEHNRYVVYLSYYESLLVVVFGLAVIAFVLPLYGVHRGMLRQRSRLKEPLYELTTRIDALTRSMLAGAISGPSENLEKLSKNLATLQETYALTSAIPTWPFDRAILRRFSIAQFVPLLALTGIAPNLVMVLEKVVSR
jgi:hypothetical protein